MTFVQSFYGLRDFYVKQFESTFKLFFIDFINLLENGQNSLTFILYDGIILRERTLKKKLFPFPKKCKNKPPPYRQERRQGGGFFMLCVQRSWTILAGVSPVTVIASEPCS